MYGKATFIKVNQLRYFITEISRFLSPGTHCFLWHSFPPCKALVFLLLAEYHLKHMLKKPTIWNSYQFPNVPSHEWQKWKVENGLSILSGLVVKLYNSKWSKYCVMILLVARRRVIIMITTEADNDKRLTWELNRRELVWTISLIVLSCTNLKLSFLFFGSIFNSLCTVLGNVSKRSLITSVTTVHGLDNQKWI